MTPDEVLAGLDPEQREAAATPRGPVCVLAGAGTGKTRAITSRIAYGVLSGTVPPQHVLAVTFTTRAAGEMRGRLRALGVVGVQARTFHSAALAQLRHFWPRVVGGEPPRIVDRKLGLVAEAAARCRLEVAGPGLRDVAAEIEWAKSTRTSAEGYPAAAGAAHRLEVAGLALPETARVYAAYEDLKTDRGLIDLEDVLLATVGILEERPDIATEVRDRYRHFTVDEYQDVNPVQQALLEAWLGDGEDVCVVGDAAQTIYSFTGATPRYLLQFPRRFPDATVVRLVRDYRSTPQVVDLANRVLARAAGPAAEAGLRLVGQRPPGPAPRLSRHDDEPAEAAAVAAEIADLLRTGVPAREIAVLVRINAQTEAFEDTLTAAGIRYVVRGAERFFDRPEVREAVVLLRGAARAGRDDSLLTAADDLVTEVRAVLATTGWGPEPPAGSQARARWESLAALVTLADDLAGARPDAGLPDLVAELEARAAAQHAPAADGVTLATLHAAKGLEWDVVFLAGLVDGTLPIVYAETREQLEEERRLLYVGITRARQDLRLSWAASRSEGGRGARRPSRFLDGLFPGTGDGAGPGGAGGARRGRGRRGRAVLPTTCAGCGTALHRAAERTRGRCDDCPPAYDEALYEALRGWRLDRSRSDKVPAYVVFTDATLEAIAERRPGSTLELAGVRGVGAAKLERYGDEVLDLVRSHPAGR